MEKLGLHGVDRQLYIQAGSEIGHDPCVLTKRWYDHPYKYTATGAAMTTC